MTFLNTNPTSVTIYDVPYLVRKIQYEKIRCIINDVAVYEKKTTF